MNDQAVAREEKPNWLYWNAFLWGVLAVIAVTPFFCLSFIVGAFAGSVSAGLMVYVVIAVSIVIYGFMRDTVDDEADLIILGLIAVFHPLLVAVFLLIVVAALSKDPIMDEFGVKRLKAARADFKRLTLHGNPFTLLAVGLWRAARFLSKAIRLIRY